MVQESNISIIKRPDVIGGLIGYPSLTNNRKTSHHEILDDELLVRDYQNHHHYQKKKCALSSSSNDMYRVVVDVPGMDASDITIRIEHNDMILHIIGERKQNISNDDDDDDDDEGMSIQRRVDNRYTIRPNVVIEQLTALLIDDVLYISAPIRNIETMPFYRNR